MLRSFDECMREWMQEKNITLARLAAMLEYKSKTTISRVVNRQSSFNACRKLYDHMMARNLLDEKWSACFQKALRVEKNGKQEYEMIQTIRMIMSGKAIQEKKMEIQRVRMTDLLIIGCPWLEIDQLIRMSMDVNPAICIQHYLTDQELAQNPVMMILLIAHLTDRQYHAVQVPEEQMASDMTRNFAIGMDRESGKAFLLTGSGSSVHWNEIDQGAPLFDECREKLNQMGGDPLFRGDQMSKGIDYIQFMELCFRMEHEHSTVIVRPAMGVQMIPTRIVVAAFDDYVEQTKDPINVSRTSLAYLLQKRFDNFSNQSSPIHLILSREGIEEFVKNGRLPDQFYALRPFTHAERKDIIDHMIQLTYKENVFLRMIRWRRGMPYACEAYENEGAIIYPCRTNYYSCDGSYRELFLPGKMHYVLFEHLIKEVEAGEYCLSTKETQKILMQYSRMLS